MASGVGLCVVFVSGLSASHKTKGRHAPRCRARCLDFILHPHPQPRTRQTRVPTQSGAISRASHIAPLLRCPRSALSPRAKSAPCREPRSEARRRRRRRDTTKPTTHANDSPRRTSRRIKRRPGPTSASREPERATVVPSLHFTPTQSGPRFHKKFISLKFWRFVLIFTMTGRSCDLFGFVVIIPKQTYH